MRRKGCTQIPNGLIHNHNNNMKKTLLFTVALVCAASLRGEVIEGPWTQLEMKTHVRANDKTVPSMTFSEMNGETWDGTIEAWQDEDGVGYTYKGASPSTSIMGIFSTYRDVIELPSYSSVKMEWKYQLRSKSTSHHSTTCLYARKGTYSDITNLSVDYSNHYETETGKEYRLDYLKNESQNGKTKKASEKTTTFFFDNRRSDVQRVDTCYLLLTHVFASSGGKTGLFEWGSFKSVSVKTTLTYCKHFSFNGNGGEGEMEEAIVDDGQQLPANAFSREGYIFHGWATEPDGPIVYPNQGLITASAEDKGPRTLYAVWTVWDQSVKEGLWTPVGLKTMACPKKEHESIRPRQMDNTQWSGTISELNGEIGSGCSFAGTSPDSSKMGIFFIYKNVEMVPSYTLMQLKWTFQIGSKSTKHHSTTCLYGDLSYLWITEDSVDFSNHYDTYAGYQYLIGLPFTNKEEDGEIRHSDNQTYTLDFDNRIGTEEQVKSRFMMMTFITASSDGRSDLDEWGYFKTIRIDTSYTYRKLVYFDANGGEGHMNAVEVLNRGNLSSNTFTRAGYTFVGWSLSPDGEVVYTDNGAVTASATDKGPVTVYAVWKEGDYALKEGPWSQKKMKTVLSAKTDDTSIRFDDMNNTKWSGTVTGWKDDEGIGFTFKGNSSDNSKMGIFSTYENEMQMPSYSRMKRTWTFQLGSHNTKHHSTTCLYGLNGSYEQIIDLAVDFSDNYGSTAGSDYLIVPPFVNENQESTAGTYYTEPYTREFVFDNIEGSMDQTKVWYLLMTHVSASGGGKQDLAEWGAFKSLSTETEWTYRKIISFNGNGGIGAMEGVNIDNSGNLPANTFTKEGYTFAGWATSHDGKIVYTDQASITATATDKGPVTLYAKWTDGSSMGDIAEGPWTLLDTCSGALPNQDTIVMTFDSLRKANYHWGPYRAWNGDNGIGFTLSESSLPADETSGFLSVYHHGEANVPAYTNRRLTWTFQVGSESSKLPNLTTLYLVPDSLTQIKKLPVVFSPMDDIYEANHTILARYFNPSADSIAHYTNALVQTIDFDNRENETAQTKNMYMMMKHVVSTSSPAPSDAKEWGAFVHVDATWEDLYYKHITFHSNDGTGSITTQEIENSDNLLPNTYTYDGYTFQGWSTTPDGEVEYADATPIEATVDNKGILDLYAKWEIIHYNITYDLSGGTADNPDTYTIRDTSFTLTPPSKPGVLFFGWTGSNGDVLQKEVTIESGSTGDKHFVARWGTNVVPATIEKINEIGIVEYTEECYSRIFVARYYYESLSEADRELVTNFSTLEAAETRYNELKTSPDEDDCSEALWPNP